MKQNSSLEIGCALFLVLLDVGLIINVCRMVI